MARKLRATVGLVLSLVLFGAVRMRASGVSVLSQAPAPKSEAIALEHVLGVPVPSDLVASPVGRVVAWVSNDRGTRNVWVAEGADFRARALTAFGRDDGQQIGDLSWTPDGRSVIFVRGNADGKSGGPLNPTSDVVDPTRAIWVAPLAGGARRLAEGQAPVVSPRGDQIAFLRREQVWTVSIAAGRAASARPFFATDGQVSGMAWSPDGRALAFSTARGAHTLIAVFHANRARLEYVSPSVDRDLYPRWSPDGRQLAFVRMTNVESALHASGRWGPIDSPWAVLVATRTSQDQDFGTAVEVWRAPARPLGSFPRNVQFFEWVSEHRLVFASEHEDWAHLYLVDPTMPGSPLALLTPGACEVNGVELGADQQTLFVASNCGDLERRHLWKVTVPKRGSAPSQPQALTSGSGVETAPAPTADGHALALLKGDARTPTMPYVLSLGPGTLTPITPNVIPATFPRPRFAEPTLAVFKAADGREIHAVVIEPPTGSGNAAARYPAIIRVHGGPTAGQELLGWQPHLQYLAARGYVVVGLNYRGGAGYGRSFREVPKEGAAGADEYQDVLAAAAYLRSRPDVDPARLGIFGASYGGYLTQLTLARNSDLFAAGVTECGIFDMASNVRPNPAAVRAADPVRVARDSSAVWSLDKWKSPVLIIHGDEDPGVDFNTQTVALARGLRARNVPFEQLVFPDEGHGSTAWAHAVKAFEATTEFFDRMLKRRAPIP